MAHVLGAQPSDRVLDLCAAPGSKATHVAQRFLGDGGVLVACERNGAKLQKMRELLKALGLEQRVVPTRADSARCVAATEDPHSRCADGTCSFESVAASQSKRARKSAQRAAGDGFAKFPPESFDRVMLDPPCSALGLRPKLFQHANAETLRQCAGYQRLFLFSAVRLLKPGGVLVYSTCTLAPDECEGMVAYALRAFPCLTLLPAEPRVGSSGRVGAGLDAELCALVQRFEPAGGVEGFFIAKFAKRATSGESSLERG